jgi:hypothetical protein
MIQRNVFHPNDPMRSPLLLSHALRGLQTHASRQDCHDDVEEQQR